MDWAGRYRDENTPWDNGTHHPELELRLPSLEPGTRVLVPGCGRGHDALYFAEHGCEVVALDVVADLAPSVCEKLGRFGGRFEVADALDFRSEEPFDLFFEQTFFCAIPPSSRPAWGELARRTLKPGGRLCAIVFPFDRPKEREGPPWQVSAEDMHEALGDGFRMLVDEPVKKRIKRREWQERWSVFERTGSAR